jgi:hypothetical protein
MAASPSVDDSFTFVGGLNTEGSYFITPKNSWKEGDNVVPSTQGSLSRRAGFDFEENHQLVSVTATNAQSSIDNNAYTVETWPSVAGNGNMEFLVVQRGTRVYFYKAASGTVSASLLPFTIWLEDFKCFGNTSVVGSNVITAVGCYGKLLITSIDTEPILVSWDEDSNTITTKKLQLKIRDFQGLRSPKAVTATKTRAEWEALDFWPDALYNLYNQGWKDGQLDAYVASKGVYPANTMQWIYGKNVDDDFDVAVLDKQDFGSSQAPRGRAILKAFYQDRAKALDAMQEVTNPSSTVPSAPNVEDINYMNNNPDLTT